jgi:hypothetical protein
MAATIFGICSTISDSGGFCSRVDILVAKVRGASTTKVGQFGAGLWIAWCARRCSACGQRCLYGGFKGNQFFWVTSRLTD